MSGRRLKATDVLRRLVRHGASIKSLPFSAAGNAGSSGRVTKTGGDQQSSLTHGPCARQDFRAFVQRQAGGARHPVIGVLRKGAEPGLVRQLRVDFPDAKVSSHDVEIGESRLHATLAATGPFDVLIDATRSRGLSRRLFRSAFLHLRDGGVYVVRGLAPQVHASKARHNPLMHLLVSLLERRGLDPTVTDGAARDRRHLAATVSGVNVEGPHGAVRRSGRAMAKLTEEEINEVLALREGRLGHLLTSRPARTFASRMTARQSPTGRPLTLGPTKIDAPAMYLRAYRDVECYPEQIAVQGNLILPDTYRHVRRARLKHRRTLELAPRFAMPLDAGQDLEELLGSWYYLDSQFRGHFGHAVTEQLSRLWAWRQAQHSEPDIRALVLPNRGRSISEFEYLLYEAAGIPRDRLVLASGPVRVERLLAATPMFSQPYYVHPDITDLWQQVGDRLAARSTGVDMPNRIFCSRRSPKRACSNGAAVEEWFTAQGFTIVHTEDYSLPDQVAMFRRAEAVAGYAGSAMFNLMFAGAPKPVLIVSSESYTARNEYLVAGALGHDVTVAWCRAELSHFDDRWVSAAVNSDFEFDFTREGIVVREWLASIGG